MKRTILTAILLAIAISAYSQSNTVQVEYFLDTDNGFGMNTVLDITSPNIDITETILADIPSSASIGYHKLYIRAKDDDGNWSQTIRKNIEIFAPNENNIVLGEYFIDVDPEFGEAITFDINLQNQDIEQAFEAQILGSTALGYHKLYGRVQDSYGNWSHTFRKNIEVYLNPDTNIVEIEYFFDEDLEFGNNTIVTIDTPEADGTWSFDVPYPSGVYSFDDVLFVRVKDSNGKWSITTILDEIGSLGIRDRLLETVTISPNPFANEIDINTAIAIDITGITVYDITGKKVYSSFENLRRVDLSSLEIGTYILIVKTETQNGAFKIIKQ
jgi:hypothetical protein